jgi:hypothetical protein
MGLMFSEEMNEKNYNVFLNINNYKICDENNNKKYEESY